MIKMMLSTEALLIYAHDVACVGRELKLRRNTVLFISLVLKMCLDFLVQNIIT